MAKKSTTPKSVAKAPVVPASKMPAAAAPTRAALTPVSSTPVRNTPIPKPVGIATPAPVVVMKREITQDMIARRAFEISQSPFCGSPEDNWFRAERELRGV